MGSLHSGHVAVCTSCFFFQAEDGIRDGRVTGVQTCALPILVREDQSANPERSPESNSLRGRRGTPPWSARYRPGRAARGGAPLLAPSLAQRILRFFVRGARAAHHPIPGPPAPSETTTAAAGES